nr:folliculin-like [Ciona intestinalis]XP_018669825.1 folliculin-like [Ciona intestinalis]|eukprot:XP_009860385.1 folliculin-like [Ciona intestinalis]
MEAVIALCHFCEQHGPSVMFTCEKILDVFQHATALTPDVTSESGSAETSSYSSSVPTSLSMDSTLTNVGNLGGNLRKMDLCEACRSLSEDDPGFVSYDRDSGTKFVSTQHPHNPEVFRLVRQACVRSLSCEVCPGREGPIMFGDGQHGYVISYTFYVKDNLARGLQRWYSIICIMKDRVFLIQSWPFLVSCIGNIIQYMQSCADSVYKIESSESPQHKTRMLPRVSNVVTPHNFRQHRGHNSNARALIQLTGNPELYPYLHTAFTWIMRACKMRFKEKIVQGARMDDDVVRDEIIERTSRSNSLATDDIDEIQADFNMISITSPCSSTEPIFTSLRHMREVLQPPLFKAIAWHLVVGNQVIWKGQDQDLITSALVVLKQLLPVGCVKMQTRSDKYLNSYKANLLGLTEKACVPSHVKSAEHFILIHVLRKNNNGQKFSHIYPSLPPNNNSMNGIEFRVTNSCILPEKGPEMLNKVEVAIANDSLSPEVVRHCLICLKEEWMNKVKILYKFTKIDNRDKEETARMLQGCLQCTDDDVRLLKFWMTGLSSKFKEELRQSALMPE